MTQENLGQNNSLIQVEFASNSERPVAENTQAVVHDIYDAQAFDEAQATYKKLDEASLKRKEILTTASALVRDVFYAFHKPVIGLLDTHEMATSHLLNRQMVEQMLSTGEYQELHHATVGDEIAAAIATVGASERMLASLDKATSRRINELARLEEQIQTLMSQAETLDALASENPDQEAAKKLANRANELGEQAKKAITNRDKLAQKLAAPPELEKVENAARQAVRSAITQAKQEIEELNAAVKAYSGGYDSGTGLCGTGDNPLTIAEKVKLAIKVKANPKLARIAEVCGRFTRIALSIQKNKVQQPPDEVVGIKTGNDLAHLVTSEFALLADPILETIFYARYAEKKLLVYELDKQEPQGRGPIIVALDSSGSMTTTTQDGLTREVWSKGAALALMAIARLQRRDIAIIHFSSPDQVRVDVFSKGKATPLEVMATAEHFYDGGTDYAGWMAQALHLVDQAAFNRADVIIVSDGEVQIPPASVSEWNRRRKEREMRSYSVLIGEIYGVEQLSQISESVTPLLDLTDDGEALNTMFSI
ncbi:MAG TPA: VWA domain-containing protein [Chloroflexia bacterium]|nr:VWA domain-containing protein [Chloroflexia bacterium]